MSAACLLPVMSSRRWSQAGSLASVSCSGRLRRKRTSTTCTTRSRKTPAPCSGGSPPARQKGTPNRPCRLHHPYITAGVPEHGLEGGDAASAVMVAGILTIHLARWIDDKLAHRKGDHDDSDG